MFIYEIVEDYLEKNKTGTIATVISREGSTPRDIGAKMFVGDDGKIHGTIGGGSLELGVFKQIMTHMGEEKPRVIHIRMDSEEIASDGMICGGNVDVFLEPVLEEYRTLYRQLIHLHKTGKEGLLVTDFDEGKLKKTLLEEDMKTTGAPLKEEDKKIFKEYIKNIQVHVADQILMEPFHFLPKLYIFGAGHVSQFIARIANLVDFYVVVIDDRAEFACRERFPDADEIHVKSFAKVFNNLEFTGREYVVIVTRGHQYDADVLEETLKRATKYVGMIGSKRKVKMIFEHMKECGFDKETIEKVYSPIGLSINAETPQEIAVAIVAELIEVKRKDGNNPKIN